MSTDTRLRELERRWKETAAPEDEVAYLVERVRIGEQLDWESYKRLAELNVEAAAEYLRARVERGKLTLKQLEWAQFLGDRSAQVALQRDSQGSSPRTPNDKVQRNRFKVDSASNAPTDTVGPDSTSPLWVLDLEDWSPEALAWSAAAVAQKAAELQDAPQPRAWADSIGQAASCRAGNQGFSRVLAAAVDAAFETNDSLAWSLARAGSAIQRAYLGTSAIPGDNNESPGEDLLDAVNHLRRGGLSMPDIYWVLYEALVPWALLSEDVQ